jgi:hypothetical protein
MEAEEPMVLENGNQERALQSYSPGSAASEYVPAGE